MTPIAFSISGLAGYGGEDSGRNSVIKIDSNHQVRWIQVSKSPLCANDLSPGYLVVLRDITAQKVVEDALRRSEERFKSLSENAPVLIFALDEAGSFTYVNPAWTSILGYPRQAASPTISITC